MSRCRKLSTDISTDARVDLVSDFAALFYTWSIPHCNDDCQFSARNSKELQLLIVPGRKRTVEEVEKAVEELKNVGLMGQGENGHFYLPSDSFYKYQTYINSNKRQETPRNSISPSPTPNKRRARKNSGFLKERSGEDPEKESSTYMQQSANLEPRLKAASDRLFLSDRVRYWKLIRWIKQGEKFYSHEIMAEALEEFWDCRETPGDDWWPYLDTILERVHEACEKERWDKGAAESDREHSERKAELRRGAKVLNLSKIVKGV